MHVNVIENILRTFQDDPTNSFRDMNVFVRIFLIFLERLLSRVGEENVFETAQPIVGIMIEGIRLLKIISIF